MPTLSPQQFLQQGGQINPTPTAAPKTLSPSQFSQQGGAISPHQDPIGFIKQQNQQATAPAKPNGFLSNLGNFGIGLLKGAGSTVEGLGKLGTTALDQTVGRVTNAVTGKGFTAPTENPIVENKLTQLTTPSNTAQQIGKGTEQVAEFLIPGGAEEEAANAAGKALENAPKIVKGASELGAKAATSAATMAGQTAIQEGSTKDVKSTATIGGLASLILGGAGKILDKAPETLWSSILKRTPAVAAKDPELAAQAAKTGLVGATRQSLSDKAGAAIQQIEVALDDAVKGAKGKISTDTIAGYAKGIRDMYKRIPGEEASVTAINNVLEDITKKPSISVQDAQQLKKDIYQHISSSYGRGTLQISATTDAQKAVARGLKTEIQKIIPGIKDLNAQHAIYSNIQDAIDKTIARQEGKGIMGSGVGLHDLLLSGIGEAAGGPLTAIALPAIKRAAESPAVLSGTSKIISYFNDLSPTKKMLFYNGIKGLVSQGVQATSQK